MRRKSALLRGGMASLLLLATAGCGGGGEGNETAGTGSVDPPASEADLANAAALANEAAADEAADMEIYGGNAAAGETGNVAPANTGNVASDVNQQ